MNRRKFLTITSAGAAGLVAGSLPLNALREIPRFRAIVFDGFVIFDSRVVNKRVEEVLPQQFVEFANLWRTRQFEYTWLRTAGQRYRDFWHVTEDALNYAAATLNLSLSSDQRDRLMNIYLELPVWPDVPDALATLRRRGIKLAFLSNLTAKILDANSGKNHIREFFEPHLTTDRVQEYKPSPKAYQMGVDAFGGKTVFRVHEYSALKRRRKGRD